MVRLGAWQTQPSRLVLALGLAGAGACATYDDLVCRFPADEHNYLFEAASPADLGARCNVIFTAADGKEALYAFPPLEECNDQASPQPCSVVNGPNPGVCELRGCRLKLDFPRTHGRDLYSYMGNGEFTHTLVCDGKTAPTGSFQEYHFCEQ